MMIEVTAQDIAESFSGPEMNPVGLALTRTLGWRWGARDDCAVNYNNGKTYPFPNKVRKFLALYHEEDYGWEKVTPFSFDIEISS